MKYLLFLQPLNYNISADMIICTTPRMIKAFKKAYNDQKASYYKKNFNQDQHVIDPPGSLEKAKMAVKAAGVAVVIELGMLTHCI